MQVITLWLARGASSPMHPSLALQMEVVLTPRFRACFLRRLAFAFLYLVLPTMRHRQFLISISSLGLNYYAYGYSHFFRSSANTVVIPLDLPMQQHKGDPVTVPCRI